jgi:hypothetical protein
MACSINNVIKYVVFVKPGCYFTDSNGNANPLTFNPSTIQGKYSAPVPGTFFNDVTTYVTFEDVIAIDSELNAGEMDSLEVPEGDRKAKNTTGIRTLPDLEISVRVNSALNVGTTSPSNDYLRFFADWWANRNLWNFTFRIMITNRAYQPLYGYDYKDLSIGKFSNESMSIEDVKKGMIKLKLVPNDIVLVDSCGNEVDESGIGNSLPASFISCS